MCIKDHSRLIFVFGFDDSIASTNQHQCNRYQDDSSSEAKPEVLIQDRLKKGEERLDNAIEALELLCEPVEPPKGEWSTSITFVAIPRYHPI